MMQALNKTVLTKEIEALKEKYGNDRSALLPILQGMQEKYNRLTTPIIRETANVLDMSAAEVEGVASFYTFFKREKQGKYVIRLCKTIACDLAGKDRVARQLENELGIKFGETTKDGMFTLEYTGCMGLCDQGPALMINDRLFAKVTPEEVDQIIEDCKRGFIKSRYPKVVPSNVKKEGPMIQHGVEKVEALKAALNMQPDQIIAHMQEANLKGRGGAGFPTGLKWKFARAAEETPKYIVCNADEGEPSTFKDRYIMYSHMDLLFDGMTIAAHAVNASKGFIYLRGEYLYWKEALEKALNDRREKNLLGKGILGHDDFNFDIEVRMGVGAYICGEETALLESLEGKRGEARNKPPYPVTHGFMNKPTVVNNVETFAQAALIMAKGVEWFKTYGTDKSTGTKLFSVSGDCEEPGIYEFPWGITVSELLKEVGGENAKAVQIGGASGHCVAREDFDRTIAYEDIPSGGSIIVFGPDRDMLEVAKNFMEFFIEESCGQCTPCREGNIKLMEGLEMMEEGKISTSYLNDLLRLANSMQIACKCGLGQSSPNAFISIINNFKNEFLGRIPK